MRLAASLVLVAMLLAGCSATELASVGGWTRSAAFTTCDQWLDEMTPDQRMAMAREMLPGLRYMVDTAADDGATLAPTFVDGITTICRSPDLAEYDEYFISAAAALAFLDDKRLAP